LAKVIQEALIIGELAFYSKYSKHQQGFNDLMLSADDADRESANSVDETQGFRHSTDWRYSPLPASRLQIIDLLDQWEEPIDSSQEEAQLVSKSQACPVGRCFVTVVF